MGKRTCFQDWLFGQIMAALGSGGLGRQLSFQEFVTFLVDKEGRFQDLKKQFKREYPYSDEHWESYYK